MGRLLGIEFIFLGLQSLPASDAPLSEPVESQIAALVSEESLFSRERFPEISLSPKLKVDVFGRKYEDESKVKSNLIVDELSLQLEVKLSENLRAVVTVETEYDWIEDSATESYRVDANELFEEAYFEWQNQNIGVAAGKLEVPFGRLPEDLPIDDLDLLLDGVEIENVFGVVSSLRLQAHKIIESIELGVFHGVSNADIGESFQIDSVSLRVSGRMTQNLSHQVSYRSLNQDERSNAASMSLQYDWTQSRVWLQGLWSDTSLVEDLNNAKIALTSGYSYRWKNSEFISEFSYSPNSFVQTGLGFWHSLREDFRIGPEVRQNWYFEQGKTGETTFGFRAEWSPP